MALTYILGGPGTGKSRMLMERLIASSVQYPKKRHIMLVPEQFTMQTQRSIVALHPRHAVLNIDILSFERLAYRVLGEVGREDLPVLSDMGKNMLLRKVSLDHQEDLAVFRRSLKKPGFVSRLMSLISEFYQYGITEEQLGSMQEDIADHPLLARKLSDLLTFYHALNQAKGESMSCAEEILPILRQLLPSSHFLEGTVIAMDSFTGFTSVQLDILKIMLCQADDVSMAFAVPKEDWKEEIRSEDLFYMSQSAVFTMNGIAKELGVKTKKIFCETKYRHAAAPELAFLADHLMRPVLTEWTSGTVSEDRICARSFRNPAAEAEYAAAKIAVLVREQGYRYRDIAVVTGDLEEYRDHLEMSFRKFGVPAFIDVRKGVLGNPLVEYLRSAIQIFPEDYSYEAVFRYLKSGMPILPDDVLDMVDNYCLACSIRGAGRWKNSWDRRWTSKAEPDFEQLNQARKAVWESLEPIRLVRNKKDGITVAERTRALRQMMEQIHAAEQMETWADEQEAKGDAELAQEYRMICSYLDQLFHQMDELLGGSVISLAEFSDILDAGLSEVKLGKIPSSVDRVQVGDVMRSRLHEIRTLIVVGFNDGYIPGVHASGGILSENERALLMEHHMNLAPTAEVVGNQERFYIYTLFTKPSEQLILTASRMGMDGNARRISYLFHSLERLFPGLHMSEGDAEELPMILAGESLLWEDMASGLTMMKKRAHDGSITKEQETLASWLYAQDPERMQSLVRTNFAIYGGSVISRSCAAALYGKEMQGSVTRLESYAKCAYAHFLNFGLALSERPDGELHSDRRGSFFHKTLEVFFRLCREREISYKEISEEECRKLVRESVVCASESEGILLMEENGKNEYLKRRWSMMADHTVDSILRFLSTEDFEPKAFELYFDGYTTPAMRMYLSDEEQMILKGVVDRLDQYRTENPMGPASDTAVTDPLKTETAVMPGRDHDVEVISGGKEGYPKVYLRVVDYKTGHTKLDVSLLYDGIQLQLPMYLEAVMEQAERVNPEVQVLPGGIYYYIVDDPCVDVTSDMSEEEIQTARDKEMQMHGMTLNVDEVKEHMGAVAGSKISTDQFDWLRHHVRKKAQQFACEIMEGNISAEPYKKKSSTGCDYCEFSGVCGFRPRSEGYHYRRVISLKEKDFWNRMEEEEKANAVDRRSEESH